jgi:phosphoribosyl-AMP cyclohydrolase
MAGGLGLSDLDPALLERLVARLRAAEPGAIGVMARGSYARGLATPQSDLDLTALTTLAPRVGYRTWFEARAGGRPLHVSAGAETLDEWRQDAGEPARWSLGFPTEETGLWIWATAAARAAGGDPPVVRRPAAGPELEDLCEAATKVQRAFAAGDGLGGRWHAGDLAELAPRLLIPLNPERRVRDRREALAAALELTVAPPGYQAAMLTALGLAPADDAAVAAAALGLARALLAFLRARAPTVDRQPDLARYLADGTLEGQLRAEG